MNEQRTETAELLAELRRVLDGRYSVVKGLGFGRGGIVVRATRIADKKDVAIKVAWKHPDAIEQVKRETEVTSTFQDPRVVPVHLVEDTEDLIVVEMPLLPGQTLGKLLDTGAPLPYDRVLEMLRGVAAVIDKAHAAGIIHGGICPEKILLGEKGECYVSDFALRVRANGRSADRPSSVGVMAYAPVEQRQDLPTADGRIDQYALAVVALELLRGQRTWRLNEQKLLQIDPIEFAVSRPVGPGVPLSAGIAIKRAMSPNPRLRFENVSDFVKGMAGLITSAPRPERVVLVDDSKADRTAPWVLAATTVLLVAAAVVLRPSLRDGADELLPGDGFGSALLLANPKADTGPGQQGEARSGVTPGADVVDRPTTGLVSITIDGPGAAEVLIDGKLRGRTPMVWTGTGKHVVTLRQPDGFTPASVTVDVQPGTKNRAVFKPKQ
ncbi:MAG TPA: serine/threonine-protein kinase [Gemmatimonadaceae bacterium]|nr:serine/threonine-protein kinase [Gemmatimonadaceae bacterium]